MKQFSKILKFELKNYFTNKIFIGITVFLVAAIALVMFFPALMQTFKTISGDNNDNPPITEPDESDRPIMLIVCETPEYAELICETFSAAFTDYNVTLSDDGVDAVKEKIAAGVADCAFAFKGLREYTYYVNNLSLYDIKANTADALLQNVAQFSAMTAAGLTPEQVQEILSLQITHETESLGKDQFMNFFYTYIMIFALYMVILLYGQMVATNVATEKSSRAMELLITSAKPVSMMFGKVIASCIAGLFQLVAVFGSALLFFQMNKAYWGENMIVASIFDMPVDLFVYMLIFFVLGFFIYAFMYGAVGSTASKLEDINTSVMPITLLFIAGFMVVMISMGSGEIDTLLMKVCSFIPFTSPMAMFTRIAMSTVPFYEICISIAVLIASVFGIGVVSAKIYRVGVLLYGTTPKIGSILRAIRKA